MKKIRYTFIAIMILITCFVINNKIYTEEINAKYKTQFISEKPTDDVLEYGKNIFKILVEKNCIECKNNKLYLCEPFITLSDSSKDIYRFLIKNEEEVITSLLIIKNKSSNELSWMLNKGKILNTIKEKISQGGIFEINTKKSNITNISELFFKKIDDKPKTNISSVTDKILEIKNTNYNIELRDVDYPIPYPDTRILPFNPKEIQINNSWCAAYVGASILSHGLEKDIRAYDIMRWAYPNTSSLLDKSISDSKLISYAKSMGSNPYYVNYALSRTEIMDEILAKRMIYAGCKHVFSNKWHAMLVYGYKKDFSYHVWNPWGEYYEIPMKSSDIPMEDGSIWTWTDSIKNWTH